MFCNIAAEMGRKGMNIQELSVASQIGYTSLRNKLSGKTEFTRKEMYRIKHCLAPDIPIDILFAEDKEAV